MSDTERFDAKAATWDEDAGRVALAKSVAEEIARHIQLSPLDDVLDFGCGTGLLSLALRPRVGSVTGADTSAGMVQVFEQKIRTQNIGSVTPYLIDATRPLAAAGRFDLIISSMALHHVRDVPALLAEFRALLREGGHVALADLDAEDGTFHTPDVKGVQHLGFDRASLRTLLAEAGFVDIRDTTAFTHRRHGREYPVFLISGRAATR